MSSTTTTSQQERKSSLSSAAPHLRSEKEELKKLRTDSKSREIVKSQFWRVLSEKWPNVREDCSKHWNGPDKADCQFEKSVMREHIEVFEHGVLMSLVVFATLRLTAHPKFQPIAEHYIKPIFRLTPPSPAKKAPQNNSPLKVKNGSTSTSTSTATATKKKNQVDMKQPTTTTAQGGRQFKSYLEKQRDAHVERIHKASEGPHDFMVATLVGLSATVFFMRPKQMRLDFEEAPLSPGRSFWSEHVCDDFMNIYKNTNPQIFDFEKGQQPDANLKSFGEFAKNCMLRSAYIDKRKQAGSEKPLVLPTHGPWNDDENDDHVEENQPQQVSCSLDEKL